MKYKIGGSDEEHDCSIVSSTGGGDHVVSINGHEHALRILSTDSNRIDFVLGNTHHRATYLEGGVLETKMILDGVEMSVMRHTGLDKIVYKNSGGKSDSATSKDSLASPIPGNVVSVAVSEGDTIKKDDPVCVLEAMKMQVSVKAHKDGSIKSLNVAQGNTIAKGFIIAEIS